MASTNSTVHAARTEEGLAFVSGSGYLSFWQFDYLECTCLYLCCESRRRMARKIRITEATPRTLWCRADDTSEGCGVGDSIGDSGGGGGSDGDGSDSSDDGGGDIGHSSKRNKCDIRSDITSVAIGSYWSDSLEPTSVFAEGAMGLGAGGILFSPGGPQDESAPSSGGRYSGGARGCNMYPMVEAMLFVKTIGTSDATNYGNSLICGGNGGNGLGAHRAQKRRAELQANPWVWQEAASQPTTKAGCSRTWKAVDEGIVWSAGGECGVDLAFAGPTLLPTAATGSLGASRVPLARVTSVTWTLPAAELTARGFRWPDGVKIIEFEDDVGNVGNKYSDDVDPEDGSPSDDSSETIEVLSFQECIDRPLEPGCVPLPRGLERIHFGANWNIELKGAQGGFPDSLEHICFPRHFNQPLTGDGVGLPRDLREITLGVEFNQPLTGVEWPPSLRKLAFSSWFDQPLEDARFPAGLREIYLPGRFNHEIDLVVWPKGLEILEFGKMFDQALVSSCVERGDSLRSKHALPAGLRNLHFGETFCRSLSGSELPDGLEVLRLGEWYNLALSVRWPSQLKRLYLKGSWGGDGFFGDGLDGNRLPLALPPKLELLSAGIFFNSPLTTVVWPPTLKVLDLGYSFNHPIGGEDGDVPLLPDGLEELRLGWSFNRSIENIRLPVSLKRLLFLKQGSIFDQGLSSVNWPPGLEELQLGDSFNQPMEGTAFPHTLRELSFGEAFTHSLQGVALPDGLTRLYFGWIYPHAHLLEMDWPGSLQDVRVGSFRYDSREFAARFSR